MLRVLTYHRIADPATAPEVHPALVSATPVEFARQVDFLARHFRPVGVEAVLRARRGEGALPRRALLVSFEDAYRDFGDVAWPILRAHGVPALLFVPTAYPDQPDRRFWWDRLYRSMQHCGAVAVATPLGPVLLRTPEDRRATLRRLEARVQSLPHDEAMVLVAELCARFGDDGHPGPPDVLAWEDLRRLAGEGVTVAAHSRWHPLLPRCSDERIRAEVRGAREDLRRELGDAPPVFAYPGGAHDARVLHVLEEEGFQLAFTHEDGHNDLRSTPALRLRRIDVTRRTPLPVLRVRLHPWFASMDRWRQRARVAAL